MSKSFIVKCLSVVVACTGFGNHAFSYKSQVVDRIMRKVRYMLSQAKEGKAPRQENYDNFMCCKCLCCLFSLFDELGDDASTIDVYSWLFECKKSQLTDYLDGQIVNDAPDESMKSDFGELAKVVKEKIAEYKQ